MSDDLPDLATCCNKPCDYWGRYPSEPCWGIVRAEDFLDDPETGTTHWIHLCRGHQLVNERYSYIPHNPYSLLTDYLEKVDRK